MRSSTKPSSRRRGAMLPLSIALCATVFGIGCGGPRVVFVNSGDVARVGPGMRGKVYVPQNDPDAPWLLSASSVTIPEGWYIVPPPPDEGVK